ncbi:MAG: hypothetical protein M1827_002136 [Pycnora praestabilis]|nr:MAG: hypothetical protein M1827_002136 [Pycnora praestabilis]
MSQTQAVHTDSIDEHASQEEKKAKSKRPASTIMPKLSIDNLNNRSLTNLFQTPDTAFRQQRLKAWQPILTPKTVLPLFFAVGIIFAPIGGLLLWASAQVQEISLDYSNCIESAPNNTFATMPSNLVSSSFSSSNSSNGNPPMWSKSMKIVNYGPGIDVPTNSCSLQFHVPDDIGPPVFFYYRLTNFYQNHRRYVKSLDTNQLNGVAVSNHTISGGACNPIKNGPAPDHKIVYPCGLIANSVFNDTFNNPVLLNPIGTSAQNSTYNMTAKGIAWSSDASLYHTTKYNYSDIVPPPNWHSRWPNGYTEDHGPPNLETDEAFQVWMRTAGLPAFSKLALRNDDQNMTGGTYQVDIDFNFPVTIYGGTKSIVISTRTVMGGKNPFLGIAYVVVGGLCVVLGALFTATHLIKPRKLGDHTYLSWNNDQPSTATASGRDVRPGTDAA